ncbi:hypothetical protein SSX86_015777 [Deinandra increscens subsp. villosa]|uniref:Uncharacterized protein n=1 Tax=Deinandra increscens subsp. villosa TaxID=3103831 RepID=A0AAP0GZD5_9ASTR
MGMKGHSDTNCGGGSGGGGWWMRKKRMAVVAVVVLAGLMGVMMFQKVKDRRLFNLVIKDKDRQIFSLHLILQKERQYAKENKRKNQDMNAKLHSLEIQKIELSNKIMEMRSTIGSLRDEHRVLESAIDEKQNQIKHKESEIKDLKSSLQTPPTKIWSVSSDDPSNREVNLTSKVMNPEVKIQKPKDEELAGLKYNTTDSEENGNGLSLRNKNLTTKRTKSDGQGEKSQLKANPDVDPRKVIPFRSRNHSSDEVHQEAKKTRSEAYRMDEDEAETETEADLDSSRNVQEADQDYKEESEE